MDWTFVVVLQIMLQPSLSVLFTVEAERTMYTSEFGEDVVMGCRFKPKPEDPQAQMRVTWHWITPTFTREVYQLDNGVEHVPSPEDHGRVKLLSDELKEGWAKLQVSRLRINDSGTYRCLVDTREGADYKTMTLSVIAPYKKVVQHIEKTPDGNKVQLTCQSEGYPESSVVWNNGHLQRLNADTKVVPTEDKLFLITSQIYVSPSDINNYTCNFTNGDHSATFFIPDELPAAHTNGDALIVVLSIGVVMVGIIIAVLMYRRRKGSSAPSTRNLLMDNDSMPPSCLKIKEENDEERNILEECIQEDLGVFLKAEYCKLFLNAEVRRYCNTFDVEDLPHRLQNNEGQPVNLQALLPEAGTTHFLEGPPGSGKTTVAQTLVCSWTEGPTHALSNLLDLSFLQLLLYVDCSEVKGDLFHEIMTQLSLKERISTQDELRTALTRSSQTLLLLDGYREGNQIFDESLKMFLNERGGCRVLVMACPDHCPMLKETVGTFGVLKLQTRTVKY
ncbi:programmed cell death 1 ligand 1-like [Mastacembelus armatus]|uniref:programmed cell death 1 ligand 1-like n=1 Tax=Mastacembelus armatus TaxID=205130 RepID=UPI000E45DEC8|nr:programmed cell death 1 ligand 1-like [Mastacembelus armatus]